MRSSSMKLSKIVEKWMKTKKGHFAVYTKNGKKFVVPLYYLNNTIFRVLLGMAEEEFGTVVDGPLQVPSEEKLMDYNLSLPRKNTCEDVEKALASMANTCTGASMSNLFPLLQSESQGDSQNAAS